MASKIKIILLASTFIGGSFVKSDGEPVLVDETIAKDLCDKGIAYKDGERVQATNSNNKEVDDLKAVNTNLTKEVDDLKVVNTDLTKEVNDLKAEIEKLNALNVPATAQPIVNKKLTGN